MTHKAHHIWMEQCDPQWHERIIGAVQNKGLDPQLAKRLYAARRCADGDELARDAARPVTALHRPLDLGAKLCVGRRVG